MKKTVKVVQVGVGPLGRLIVRHIVEKRKGLELVGAVDINPEYQGKDLGEVCGLRRKLGIEVGMDAAKVFGDTNPDVAIYATSSFLKDVFQQIEPAISSGVSVISTCEQLAYPYFSEPELTQHYDRIAREHGVRILGTGINPGFLMDLRAIVLTTGCTEVESLEIIRVMDASLRRESFQRKIGAAMTRKEFLKAVKEGRITGHVGLEESICLIAEAVGWQLSDIVVEGPDPVIAEEPVKSSYFEVPKGAVKGVRQLAYGIKGKKRLVKLEFAAYLGAQPSYDEVRIHGVPDIVDRISPCWHGDHGTVAMVVNLIPTLLAAPYGVLTITDLVPLGYRSGNIVRFLSADGDCC